MPENVVNVSAKTGKGGRGSLRGGEFQGRAYLYLNHLDGNRLQFHLDYDNTDLDVSTSVHIPGARGISIQKDPVATRRLRKWIEPTVPGTTVMTVWLAARRITRTGR